MTYANSTRSWRRYAPRLVPLLLLTATAVCLGACSMLSASGKEEPSVKIVSNDAHLPDVPKHLAHCVQKQPAAGDTADQMVLNRVEVDEERRACGRALLRWYTEVQAANTPRTGTADRIVEAQAKRSGRTKDAPVPVGWP